MTKIETLLVAMGREKRCGVIACPEFTMAPTLDIGTYAAFQASSSTYIGEIFKFADIRRSWWFYYWRSMVYIASSLLNIREAPANPRLIAFTDDGWPDAPDRKPVQEILGILLTDRRWTTFALRRGIVTCVFSHDDATLGRHGDTRLPKVLTNMGVDLIIDDRRRSGDEIALEVERCFELLLRQDRLHHQSSVTSWADTVAAFLVFGVCQKLGEDYVPWLAGNFTSNIFWTAVGGFCLWIGYRIVNDCLSLNLEKQLGQIANPPSVANRSSPQPQPQPQLAGSGSTGIHTTSTNEQA